MVGWVSTGRCAEWFWARSAAARAADRDEMTG